MKRKNRFDNRSALSSLAIEEKTKEPRDPLEIAPVKRKQGRPRIDRRKQIWAIYNGDRFIDVGTLQELHSRLGLSAEYIMWLSHPCNKRTNQDGLISLVVCMEDDLFDNKD